MSNAVTAILCFECDPSLPGVEGRARTNETISLVTGSGRSMTLNALHARASANNQALGRNVYWVYSAVNYSGDAAEAEASARAHANQYHGA